MVARQSVHDGRRSRQSDSRCRSGVHAVRSMGTVRGRGAVGVDCDQPLLQVCGRAGCGWSRYLPCKNSRESICRRCSVGYRRRIGEVALSGLNRRPGRFRVFGTVTAIGDSVHCKKPNCDRAPYCNHEICPCTTDDSPDLADWNCSHARRWNHFLTLMRRQYPGFQFMRGVEPQSGDRRRDHMGRGALHDHWLADADIPILESTVRKLAMRAGFGHSVKVLPVEQGSKREAYYVSKYITKASDQRSAVPWRADVIDPVTGELHEGQLVDGRYRTWSTSRRWGLTLGQARYCAWWRWAMYQDDVQQEQLESVMSELALAFSSPAAGPEPP
jgi:hypothetical protein